MGFQAIPVNQRGWDTRKCLRMVYKTAKEIYHRHLEFTEVWNSLGDLGLQKIVWWSSKTSEPWRKNLSLALALRQRLLPTVCLGGGFKHVVMFSPIWGNDPNWLRSFKRVGHPPTSCWMVKKVMIQVGIMRWCNWRREIQPRSRCRFLVVYPKG